jgi:adenylate kinase family enzyme
MADDLFPGDFMKSLDEQIPDIERLDQARRRAKRLREEAIDALTAHVYQPRPRASRSKPPVSDRDNWSAPIDDVEKAEMLRALTAVEPKGEEYQAYHRKSKSLLIDYLSRITYEECVAVGNDDRLTLDRIPIFRSALVLQALAETPGYALSSAALACLFCIAQELNSIGAPTWIAGSARAGDSAAPTAFVTAECARALLALEYSLLQTAKAAELLGAEIVRREHLSIDYAVWHEQEEAFRKEALAASLEVLRPKLIIRYAQKGDSKEWVEEVGAEGLVDDNPKTLLDRIKDALGVLPAADFGGVADAGKPDANAGNANTKKAVTTKPDAGHPGSASGTAQPKKNFAEQCFAEAAKRIAENSVNDLLKALRASSRDKYDESPAKNIAERLRHGARVVRELLEPLEEFANSVIDRQLAAGQAQLGMPVDDAELLFAANLLGLVADWGKPKIKAAYEILRPKLSVNGRLLAIRPFDVDPSGYRLNVQTIEITRRMADLIANIDVEPEPQFVDRLMRPLEDGRVPGETKADSGWTIDAPGPKRESLWWMTALVVDVLDSVIRMLDQAINRQVLTHFGWRKPEDLKLELDALFYPDYGLMASDRERPKNIAFKLQSLRAHAGHGPKGRKAFSLVLYGPPGTGKTTLVEALAKSANVPLVEITPSDILVGGEEAVERRTRQVFQTLSKLTHVVILFDEFDPILQDRAKRDSSQLAKSVFEFLTPGMLPKLKALNEAAKEQRLSYVLATNFVYDLDPAVRRKGRFDDRHGIYPPDATSRYGRLLEQLTKMQYDREQRESRKAVITKALAELKGDSREELRLCNKLRRELSALNLVTAKKVHTHEVKLDKLVAPIFEILKASAGGPMDQLAMRGWFTLPADDKDFKDSIFGHLFEKSSVPKIQAEATYAEEKAKYTKARERDDKRKDEKPSDLEIIYWNDWDLTTQWDKSLKDWTADPKTFVWKDLHEQPLKKVEEQAPGAAAEARPAEAGATCERNEENPQEE